MNRVSVAAALVFMPLAAVGAIKTEPIPDLRPPRAELPPEPERKDGLPWILGGAGLAAVALAFLWPRRKAAPPPESPYAVAQSAIAELRADHALVTPVSVSAMVRNYAAKAFGLPGTGVTAEDVASGLAARRNCPVELASQVWRFLADCDVAKFAPGVPDPGSGEMLERAGKLIDALENARATAARTI